MNCLEFYDAVCREEYKNNPVKAEILYYWGKKVGLREALPNGKFSENIENDLRYIWAFYKTMGLTTEQMTQLIDWFSIDWLNKNLRVEFDEEYVEYFHFDRCEG